MSFGIIVMLASLGVLSLVAVKIWFLVQLFKKINVEHDKRSD
jgi:uncharacterized membrane protein